MTDGSAGEHAHDHAPPTPALAECTCGRDDGQDCAHCAAPTRSDAIVVTVNPEARISVQVSPGLIPAAVHRRTLSLPVVIVNQGFVTARLHAAVVAPVPGVDALLSVQDLSGRPRQQGTLTLGFHHSGMTDVTVEFRFPNEKPDLGERGRFHFLVDCSPSDRP